MTINTCDLKQHNLNLKKEILDAISNLLRSNSLVLGDFLKLFEMNLARYWGVNHIIGVANGTNALHLTLKALKIVDGAEIIIPASAYNATVSPSIHNNAKIVLVDADKKNHNMSISCLEEIISKNTRLILPVHLYGRPCDIGPIMNLAAKYGSEVVFDACQAHGSKYNGKNVACFGRASCFSFYPTKNLGCLGDGGAISTDDDCLNEILRKMRNHGQSSKDNHEILGFNSRLDDLQAAILDVKLKYLDSFNESRKKIASIYNHLLFPIVEEDIFELPHLQDFTDWNYHLFPILVKNRDELKKYLREQKGINLSTHYPVPIHLQPAFKQLGYKKGDFPVSEKIASMELSLPIYPELTEDKINYVASSIKYFLSKKSR